MAAAKREKEADPAALQGFGKLAIRARDQQLPEIFRGQHSLIATVGAGEELIGLGGRHGARRERFVLEQLLQAEPPQRVVKGSL